MNRSLHHGDIKRQNKMTFNFTKIFGLEVVAEYCFHPTRRWRFDFAIPDKMIAIEIEGGSWSGGRHTRGAGYNKDMKKYNEAVKLGWRLLRYPKLDWVKIHEDITELLKHKQI